MCGFDLWVSVQGLNGLRVAFRVSQQILQPRVLMGSRVSVPASATSVSGLGFGAVGVS